MAAATRVAVSVSVSVWADKLIPLAVQTARAIHITKFEIKTFVTLDSRFGNGTKSHLNKYNTRISFTYYVSHKIIDGVLTIHEINRFEFGGPNIKPL